MNSVCVVLSQSENVLDEYAEYLSLTSVNSQLLHLHCQRTQIINALSNTLTLLPSIPPNYHQLFKLEAHHKSHVFALKRQPYQDTPESLHPIDP